jgi:putative oxidoreductase
MQIAPLLDTGSSNVVVMSSGLLIGRLVFGLIMSAHGAQKLFGWFGGYGLAGTGGFLEQIGFRPGRVFAAVAATTEVAAGLLIAFGFLGAVGPALMLSVMIVAAVSVHWGKGFFGSTGIELTLLYGAAAVALALTGPGLFSLDAVFGLAALSTPAFVAGALAVGIIGAIGNLFARRPAAASAVSR